MKNKNYRIVSDENGTFKINKDGSRFIGVLETTTRGSHPFHSVVSAEVVSTKECFVTETTSPATASSDVCPKKLKSMSVDKMVRSSKTYCFTQILYVAE